MTPLLSASKASVVFVEPSGRHSTALQGTSQHNCAAAQELLSSAASLARIARYFVSDGQQPDLCEWAAHPAQRDDKRIFAATEAGPVWTTSGLAAALAASNKANLVICGFWLEARVSFLALSALSAGFEVFVAVDATPSRVLDTREAALARLVQCGVVPTTTHQLLAEWADQSPDHALATALRALLPSS